MTAADEQDPVVPATAAARSDLQAAERPGLPGMPDWTHPAMFYLSLVFLFLVSALLVFWIYFPIVSEQEIELMELATETRNVQELQRFELSDEELRLEGIAYQWGVACATLIVLIWPVFIIERLIDRVCRLQNGLKPNPLWWMICFIPPLRLCSRRLTQSGDATEIWFPRAGWKVVSRHLQRELERAFSVPMICIALLILPVLGIQLYFASAKHNIVDFPVLRFLLNFGTGLIWFAFTTEFIVMVSVAEKKFAYCKKHWLDLIIILLPLVSFLRTISFVRATKLAKLGKLQQLSRLVRVYRLRGVSMRALRALLVLEVIHRLLRTKPEKRIRKLEEQYLEKQRELEFLQEEIDRIKAIAAAKAGDKMDSLES